MIRDINIIEDFSNLNNIKLTVTPEQDAFGTVTLNVVALVDFWCCTPMTW